MIARLDDPLHAVEESWAQELLDVGDGHELFVEQSGNRDGVPFVSIHGGPGGASSKAERSMISPQNFRIIQFDQRGCGKSKPPGCIEHNSLQHTIADLERIRIHLGIEQWAVGGGSWGSTVALAYAQAHPNRVLGIIVTSVWLLRKQDIDWWYGGVRSVFPEVWDQYAEFIPEEEGADLRAAYHRKIFGDDPSEAEAAACKQYQYEMAIMYLEAPLEAPSLSNALNYSRIFSHYAINNFFLHENQLLDHASLLGELPMIIVGARYDMCTPFKNAYDLAKALPHAAFLVANTAGHLPVQPVLASAIVDGVSKLHELIAR